MCFLHMFPKPINITLNTFKRLTSSSLRSALVNLLYVIVVTFTITVVINASSTRCSRSKKFRISVFLSSFSIRSLALSASLLLFISSVSSFIDMRSLPTRPFHHYQLLITSDCVFRRHCIGPVGVCNGVELVSMLTSLRIEDSR